MSKAFAVPEFALKRAKNRLSGIESPPIIPHMHNNMTGKGDVCVIKLG